MDGFQLLKVLEAKDLNQIICSWEDEVSVADWMAHTTYIGGCAQTTEFQWFWEIVEEMTSSERRSLLYFATSIKALPRTGFEGLDIRFVFPLKISEFLFWVNLLSHVCLITFLVSLDLL